MQLFCFLFLRLAYSSFSKYVQLNMFQHLCVMLSLPSVPQSLYLPLLKSHISSKSQFRVLSLMIVLVQYYYKKQTPLAKKADFVG
jgi:hypothetical protein